jgi:hypothetical protein
MKSSQECDFKEGGLSDPAGCLAEAKADGARH